MNNSTQWELITITVCSPEDGHLDCSILLLVPFKVRQELKDEWKNDIEDGDYRS